MNSNTIFTKQQEASLQLMQNDLRFLYTLASQNRGFKATNIVSSMPYLGLIVDGVEDWFRAYNNSHKNKIDIPVFTAKVQVFYEKMRSNIKLWGNSYSEVYSELERLYQLSDKYFSNLCKPIAKAFKLYDVFGADLSDECYCGNTILCCKFIPDHDFYKDRNKEFRELAEIGGKYAALFHVTSPYPVKEEMSLSSVDYGGFIKSPVGNRFGDRFVLFSLLCQLNYIIKCIDEYILEETTSKLRFAYILYYYTLCILPEINVRLSAEFSMDERWKSDAFRNAMAHYKMGVALKEEELVFADPFYGLTQKYFNCDYGTLKSAIISNIKSLSMQIHRFLKLPKRV